MRSAESADMACLSSNSATRWLNLAGVRRIQCAMTYGELGRSGIHQVDDSDLVRRFLAESRLHLVSLGPQ